MSVMAEAPLDGVEVAAFRVPTDKPEADGTFAWTSTTLLTVHVTAAGFRGFGFAYGSAAALPLIRDELGPLVVGLDALAVERIWNALVGAVRN
ncbi:MAG TPA: mandelate racemase, partial [Polyangia bacterium]